MRSLIHRPRLLDFLRRPARHISARPWALPLLRPMTLPMSLILEAPVAATASLIRGAIFGAAQLRSICPASKGDFLPHLPVDQILTIAGLDLHTSDSLAVLIIFSRTLQLRVLESDAFIDCPRCLNGIGDHANDTQRAFSPERSGPPSIVRYSPPYQSPLTATNP